MHRPYKTDDEIRAVVEGFEGCTTARDSFTHREHLTVAVWYLYHFAEDQALAKMRDGLLKFLDHHGVATAKYKEELTVKWIRLTRETLEGFGSGQSVVEATNRVLVLLGDSRLISND